VSLNPAQRAAIAHVDGPLLVLAGAGSGKTRVITEKIAHLVRQGMAPDRITAITFTNKAAREMSERAERLLARSNDERRPRISTFHALGLKFLQVEHARAGLRRGFTVFDADDSGNLVRDLLPAGTKTDALNTIRSLISNFKDQGLAPEAAAAAARTPRELDAATVYAQYQRRLAAFNAVDFDDLIARPVALLEADADLVAAWRERIRYLLVDEYQDTNEAQYRLLRALAGPRGAMTVVGDDDQSIYAWRGAKPENLRELARDWPALTVIKLEQNYRCAQRILRAANTLIANNPHLFEKRLWSEGPEGPPIRVLGCADDQVEAERVAAEIAYRQQATRAPWSEFAILYRGNHQSRALEQALRLAGVPYRVVGGTGFFERTEVKDLLAWVRLVANPDDDAAFLRAIKSPPREVGATTLEKLGEIAGARHLGLLRTASDATARKLLAPRPAAALAEFVGLIDKLRTLGDSGGLPALARELVPATGYDRHLRQQATDPEVLKWKLANVAELVDWLGSGSLRGGIAEVAAQIAILAGNARDEAGNQVRLMTMHSAKGLEFRFVHVIGCEEGLLPHEGSIDEGRLDEERRLFYVAITRAKEALVLSHAESKRRFGQMIRATPSRFLAELPQDDLAIDGADPEADAEGRKQRARSHLDRLSALFDP
jgi:ATP-dependent DNA helicase Rep